ncbi:MAG: hypothetical protein IJ272_00760, partial [Clostridia bacterium]|nr:hypothetical protein [Clostridia bacterium]
IVGGILKEINGVPMTKILKRFDSIIVNETNGGLKSIFQKYNSYGFLKVFLEYLNIAKASTTTFTIYKDGENIDVELKAIDISELNNTNVVYSLEDIEVDMRPMWYKVYYKNNKAPFAYEHDYVNNVLYFQYNSCVDSSSSHLSSYREGLPSFQQFFDEMIMYMQNNQGSYNSFIIDLRYNTGGDYYLLRDAIDRHMDFLRTQNIKVLIGYNYSAGHMAVEDILRISPYIKLYGEESSSAIRNYTEITNSTFELDNCKWVIQVPMMEDFGENLKNRQTDWNTGIIPDFAVNQTYGDYLTGIDTAYMYAVMN